jgi:hypothetical protein
MAYPKTNWSAGMVLTSTRLNNRETQYDEAVNDVNNHATGAGAHAASAISVTNFAGFMQEWDTQPFSLNQTTVNSNTGGILNVTSTGTDPMIHMHRICSLDPNIFRWIEIRYRVVSGVSGGWEIFFTNDLHTTANGAHNIVGSLVDDGVWRTARIDGWSHSDWKTNGDIRGFRYDWCRAADVNMELDYIRIIADASELETRLANLHLMCK